MTIATSRPQDPAVGNRRGSLAIALQEALTITARLRANRQVATDAEQLRAHVKRLLAAADEAARQAGYASADVRLAIYAVTVFVDESVLNSTQPMFANWSRQPLQEEIFGGHTGGETFFQNLRELLGRQDSDDLADLLEVCQLCMLLGLRGRYSIADPSQLTAITTAVADKMQRIRGAWPPLSPAAALPSNEHVPVSRDPWIRRLMFGLLGAGVFAFMLFIVFRLSLQSGLSGLRTVTSQLAP